jgi:deoxyadenosine/deoxycytidine kinase
VHEPVDQWQCVPTVEGGTLNLLDRFYSDPERYAYTFQNYVFMSRVLQVRFSASAVVQQHLEAVLHLCSTCVYASICSIYCHDLQAVLSRAELDGAFIH